MAKTSKYHAFYSSISSTERILAVLACISIIILLTPKHWFSRTLVFNPADYKPSLTSDRYEGGNSRAVWENESQHAWKCFLSSNNPRYCSVVYELKNSDGTGLDLSRYQTFTIWASYKGSAKTIRLYLRNIGEPYYRAENPTTTKYNRIELPVHGMESGLTFEMEAISVADWWLVIKDIPLELSQPEFNQVVFLELQTGTMAEEGEHSITLDKIIFKGIVFSNEFIFKSLIIIWCSLIAALLLIRMVKLNSRLKRENEHQQELVQLNKILNLKNKEIVDLAKKDHLTGLLNRIGIRDILYNALKAWNESRTPFSFIMIDIDHFKQVNDTWGHDVGDLILKGTADLLATNIRRSDALARWGGEEFILACNGTDLYQAQITAELLRRKLESTPIHPEIKVTASFGVSSLARPDLDELFTCADQALYDAKNQGRNRVCVRAHTNNEPQG